MTIRTTNFKNPLRIVNNLDTALAKEMQKYKACPVNPDMMHENEALQAWGYVVAGYFLAEESFKALLHLRKQPVPRKHSLTLLFDLFDDDDRKLLREYYTDYLATNDGYGNQFPFETLDEFLANLDGDPNPNPKIDDYVGSFDWRYFLIEKNRSNKMPLIGIELLHEIAYGCTRMVAYAHNGRFDPARHTHSWRLRWKRREKYDDWLFVQTNSGGWDDLVAKLAILWGPDYRGRCDMVLFKANRVQDYFAEMPEGFSLPLLDKRKELEEFDTALGFRSIGVTIKRPLDDGTR